MRLFKLVCRKIKEADEFIRHGGWMFAATSLTSLFNLFFQLFLVRFLSPVDYGVFNSLLALLLVLSIPAGTLQTVVTKYTSLFQAKEEWRETKHFLLSLAKKVFFFGLIFFALILVLSPVISSFLRIEDNVLVVMIGVLIIITVLLPLALGGLQGLQIFKWLGLSGIFSAAAKLLLGMVFVGLGFRVAGALTAYMISSFLFLAIAFFRLRIFIRRKYPLSKEENDERDFLREINFKEIYSYFIPVAVTLFCFMTLINVDIILVKHFFSPLEAGYYSVAQMAGKIILFLPGAITIVMFPMTSNLQARNQKTFPLLFKSLVVTGLICGGAALLVIFFPEGVLRALTGSTHPDIVGLTRLFAVAMTFFALLYTVLFYRLSLRQTDFLPYLVFFTLAQIALIIFFRERLTQVVAVLCFNSLTLFIVNLFLVWRFKQKESVQGGTA